MRTIFLLMTISLALSGMAIAASDAGQNDALVKELEAQHAKYITAGKAGDVDGYIGSMTKERVEDINAKLKKAKMEFTSDLLKKVFNDSELKGLQLLSIETSGNVARTVYQKPGDDMSTWIGIMFHKEGDEWKVGEGAEITYAGDMAKDGDKAMAELLAKPIMQLK